MNGVFHRNSDSLFIDHSDINLYVSQVLWVYAFYVKLTWKGVTSFVLTLLDIYPLFMVEAHLNLSGKGKHSL